LREHLQQKKPEPERASPAERARRSLEAMFDDVQSQPGPAFTSHATRLPTYDVLGFLSERASVEPWQREILRMVRAEAYYFMPQRMTKIMNEGWASMWHSRILTGGVLDPSEIIDFADCHSGATAAGSGQLNPYKLGIELYRYAEEQGLDIFRLRRIPQRRELHRRDRRRAVRDAERALRVRQEQPHWSHRSARRKLAEVKEKLLQELAWGGLPQIELVEEDYEGRGELLLAHHHDGRDLQLAHAGETLKHLALLWQASGASLDAGRGPRPAPDERRQAVQANEAPLGTPKHVRSRLTRAAIVAWPRERESSTLAKTIAVGLRSRPRPGCERDARTIAIDVNVCDRCDRCSRSRNPA